MEPLLDVDVETKLIQKVI